MSNAELFKFDVRVRGRMLRSGQLTEEQCNRHLAQLKDAADSVETVELQQPALIRVQHEPPPPPPPVAEPEPEAAAAAPEPEPEAAAAAPEPEPEAVAPQAEPEAAAAASEPEPEAAASSDAEPAPEAAAQDSAVDGGWDGGLFDDEGKQPS
jgi:outer membrane biosynthesis protein TonB